MLQLIMGTGGTGKSTEILRRAAECANSGKKVIYIVPEQISFDKERAVLKEVNGAAALNIKVFSYKRLSEDIFRTYGGICGEKLTDTARQIIMHLAVGEVKDSLTVYGKATEKHSFIGSIVGVINNFKGAGVYPEDIEKIIEENDSEEFNNKLRDILLIYSVYEGIVEESYVDPLDDIERAVKAVEGTDYFNNTSVFIDEFDFLSLPERNMTDIILSKAENVTVALKADGLNINDGFDIFSVQKATAKKLITYAQKNGIKVGIPKILEGNKRSKTENLKNIEDSFLGRKYEKSQLINSCKEVECGNKYEETEYCAAEIIRLVRDCGYRYKDINVVARNIASYEAALTDCFKKYEIPLFMSKGTDVLTNPFCLFILSAIRTVKDKYRTEDVLKLAHSPALGLSLEESSKIESFSYVWNIKGKDWLKPVITAATSIGKGVKDSEEEAAELEAIRQKIIEPLKCFEEKIKNCTGADFAKALYEYIEEVGAADNIFDYYEQTADEEDKENFKKIYGAIIDVLDTFSKILENVYLPLGTILDIFKECVELQEIAGVPNTADSVIAGSANSFRYSNPKAVFILGANYGTFPAFSHSTGFFTRNEEKLLANEGYEIALSAQDHVINEKNYVYSAITAPSELLYILYSKGTLSGEVLEKSDFLRTIEKEKLCISESYDGTDDVFFINDLFTLRDRFVKDISRGNYDLTFKNLLQQLNDNKFVSDILRISEMLPEGNILPLTARALVGDSLTLSPTKIERFYKCPFMFFAENMLNLKKLKKIDFTSMTAGEAVHYVLEKVLKEVGADALSKASDSDIKGYASKYLSEYMGEINKDNSILNERFNYLLNRYTVPICMVLRKLSKEFSQSKFRPVGFEVPIGRGKTVASPCFNIEGDFKIWIKGIVDRIDKYKGEFNDYIRVVDYKTGLKRFDLDEVYNGINMQMLIYLFALCDDENKAFGDVEPAGVLYMPSSAERQDNVLSDEESNTEEMDKTFKMNGLLLENMEVLTAMESELKGEFIPASVKTNGELKANSSTKSPEEFAAIKRNVEKKIRGIGAELLKGKTEPEPLSIKNRLPCEFCDYYDLCKNYKGLKFKELEKGEN